MVGNPGDSSMVSFHVYLSRAHTGISYCVQGVYKLDSLELYKNTGASKAVYELIAYQRGESVGAFSGFYLGILITGIKPKRREPRFLYYMNNYKEWVITSAVGQ